MLRKVAQAATVSPSAVQTPPWTKPPGCRWRLSTTIRPREWVSSISSGSIPRSPGKLPGRKAADALRRDRELGCGASSLIAAGPYSTPNPSSPWSPKGSSRSRTASRKPSSAARADEAVALLGVAGDAVEEGPQQLGLVQALRVERLVDEHLHHHQLVDRHPGDPLEQALEARVELLGRGGLGRQPPLRPPARRSASRRSAAAAWPASAPTRAAHSAVVGEPQTRAGG